MMIITIIIITIVITGTGTIVLFNININDSRSEHKDMTYISKQLSLAVNYLLDSTVRAPVHDVSY